MIQNTTVKNTKATGKRWDMSKTLRKILAKVQKQKKKPKNAGQKKQRLEKCTKKYIVEATEMPNSKIN